MGTDKAREFVDRAIYEFVKLHGFNPDTFDYDGINDMLNLIQEGAEWQAIK